MREYRQTREQIKSARPPTDCNQTQQRAEADKPHVATPDAGAKRKRIQPQLVAATEHTCQRAAAADHCRGQRMAPEVSAASALPCSSSTARLNEPVRITVLRVAGVPLQVRNDAYTA